MLVEMARVGAWVFGAAFVVAMRGHELAVVLAVVLEVLRDILVVFASLVVIGLLQLLGWGLACFLARRVWR